MNMHLKIQSAKRQQFCPGGEKLKQKIHNFSVLAMELHLFCNKPSVCSEEHYSKSLITMKMDLIFGDITVFADTVPAICRHSGD